MTAIRVVCRGCGQEVNSAEVDREVRCTLCVARTAVGQLVRQYERLWAKRTRYRRAGAPHVQLERQIGRLAVRIGERLHQRIGNPQRAGEVLNALLSEARQRADSSGGKILVPRLGQELAGEGARA